MNMHTHTYAYTYTKEDMQYMQYNTHKRKQKKTNHFWLDWGLSNQFLNL